MRFAAHNQIWYNKGVAIKEIQWDVAMDNKAIARYGFGWVLEPIRFNYDGLAVEPIQNFKEVNQFEGVTG